MDKCDLQLCFLIEELFKDKKEKCGASALDVFFEKFRILLKIKELDNESAPRIVIEKLYEMKNEGVCWESLNFGATFFCCLALLMLFPDPKLAKPATKMLFWEEITLDFSSTKRRALLKALKRMNESSTLPKIMEFHDHFREMALSRELKLLEQDYSPKLKEFFRQNCRQDLDLILEVIICISEENGNNRAH